MWRLLKGDFTAMGGQAGTIANALAELPGVLKETESVGKARMVIADADYGVKMADWDKDPFASRDVRARGTGGADCVDQVRTRIPQLLVRFRPRVVGVLMLFRPLPTALQVFNDIRAECAVLVVFPGLEAALPTVIDAMLEGGLTVNHIVWDKGYKGGNLGARLNYSTEDILIGYTSHVSGLRCFVAQPRRCCRAGGVCGSAALFQVCLNFRSSAPRVQEDGKQNQLWVDCPGDHREDKISCPPIITAFKVDGISNPYQKPRPLYMELLYRFTRPMDTVVELTGGSGTLLAACALRQEFENRNGEKEYRNSSRERRSTSVVVHCLADTSLFPDCPSNPTEYRSRRSAVGGTKPGHA